MTTSRARVGRFNVRFGPSDEPIQSVAELRRRLYLGGVEALNETAREILGGRDRPWTDLLTRVEYPFTIIEECLHALVDGANEVRTTIELALMGRATPQVFDVTILLAEDEPRWTAATAIFVDVTDERAASARLRDSEWTLEQLDSLRVHLDQITELHQIQPVLEHVRRVLDADAAWLIRDVDAEGAWLLPVAVVRGPYSPTVPKPRRIPMDDALRRCVVQALSADEPTQFDFGQGCDDQNWAAVVQAGSWLTQALRLDDGLPWLLGVTASRVPRLWRPPARDLFHRICRVFEADLSRRLLVERLRTELAARGEAERQTQASESRLRTLIDASPDIICFKDGAGRWLEANAADLELFQLQGVPYRGRTDAELAEFTHPCYREAFLTCETTDEAAWAAGGISRGEEHIPRPEADDVVLDVIKVPVFRADGEREGLIVLGRDVTARRKAEAGQRLATAVVEQSGEAILVTDAWLRIVSVNPSFTRIFGYEPEAVIGRAQAFLRSPQHDREFYVALDAAVRAHDRWAGEMWYQRRDGEGFPSWTTISAVRDGDGEVTHYVACVADISALRRSEARVAYLARHDSLTGLPNRLGFEGRLFGAAERAQRQGGSVGVLILGLDGFRHVNDSHGQLAGDALLAQVGDRLQALAGGAVVARLGADEFAVLITSASKAVDLDRHAERLRSAFAEPFRVGGHMLFSACSIGGARIPDESESADALIRDALAALHAVKASGRGTFRLYNQALTRAAAARVELESELRLALRSGALHLAFQPIFYLDDDQVAGFEALARWTHPELGVISPARFIPVAEAAGLIGQLGDWALDAACRQAAAWIADGHPLGFVAVNVSGRQLDQAGAFIQTVERVLRSTGLAPEHLEIEVTESALLGQPEQALAALYALRQHGVRIAIDDFGTGYSALAQVRRLPAHKLKLDQSFVRDLPDDPNDCAIARTVLALGRGLGLTVVAEGVETPAQRDFLRAEGCPLVQGYLYGRPVPPDEAVKWLVTGR